MHLEGSTATTVSRSRKCIRLSTMEAARPEQESSRKASPVLLIGLVIAVLAAFMTLGLKVDQPPSSNGERKPEGQLDIRAIRFEQVQRIFGGQGARAERDPKATSTVRIFLPLSVAMAMNKLQAQNIASETRSNLWSEAIVYIKTPFGETLAKATPWGVE